MRSVWEQACTLFISAFAYVRVEPQRVVEMVFVVGTSMLG
jgi:hypothetical protein